MPKRAKRRTRSETTRPKGASVQLTALIRERDKLNKRPTRQGKKRQAELGEQINAARSKLARAQQQEGAQILIEPTGFVGQHEDMMTTFASANDVVMLWRPVHPQAAAKLQGQYQTDGTLINQFKGKAFNVKGKSSTLPPLSADIPADVRLSKVQSDQPEKVAEYQEKNDTLLRKSAEEIIFYREKIGELQSKETTLTELLDLLHEANEAMLMVTENLRTDQDYVVYYVLTPTQDIELTQTDEQKPILLEQREDILYQYNYATNNYDIPYELQESYEARPIQRLAYLQFILDSETQTVKEKIFPITADYDELASTGRKIYPFLNNREGIRTRVTAELYKKLAHHQSTPVNPIEIAASVVLEYELAIRRNHRERAFIEGIGIADDLQWALKVFLKGETEGATNHGAEVDSPFPQPITEGRYPVFLPSGHIVILHNEQELCDFINQQRSEGFLLDVNPKWGWEINDAGALFIPERRFNWDAVHEGLRSQQIIIEELESLKEQGTEIDEELLELTIAKHVNDIELMDLKVNIERLKLEPPLIYSSFVNNYLEKPVEDEEEKAFRLAVQQQVKEMEATNRGKKEEDLNSKYNEMKGRYAEDHDSSSLVEQQEETLLEIPPFAVTPKLGEK